jgi:hypothetical protein
VFRFDLYGGGDGGDGDVVVVGMFICLFGQIGLRTHHKEKE